MNLGEKPNQTNQGGRRTNGFGNWCWSAQTGETSPGGLWMLERDSPVPALETFHWGSQFSAGLSWLHFGQVGYIG